MNGYPDRNSVVDTLKSNGCPSDYGFRKELYENTYGGVYHGTASQNVRMNNALHSIFG